MPDYEVIKKKVWWEHGTATISADSQEDAEQEAEYMHDDEFDWNDDMDPQEEDIVSVIEL